MPAERVSTRPIVSRTVDVQDLQDQIGSVWVADIPLSESALSRTIQFTETPTELVVQQNEEVLAVLNQLQSVTGISQEIWLLTLNEIEGQQVRSGKQCKPHKLSILEELKLYLYAFENPTKSKRLLAEEFGNINANTTERIVETCIPRINAALISTLVGCDEPLPDYLTEFQQKNTRRQIATAQAGKASCPRFVSQEDPVGMEDIWSEALVRLTQVHGRAAKPHTYPPERELELYRNLIDNPVIDIKNTAISKGVSRKVMRGIKTNLDGILASIYAEMGLPLPPYIQKANTKTSDHNHQTSSLNQSEKSDKTYSSLIDTHVLNRAINSPDVRDAFSDLPYAEELFISFAENQSIKSFLSAYGIKCDDKEVQAYNAIVGGFLFREWKDVTGLHELLKRVLYTHWFKKHAHWGDDNSELAQLSLHQGIHHALAAMNQHDIPESEKQKAATICKFLALMVRMDLIDLGILCHEHDPKRVMRRYLELYGIRCNASHQIADEKQVLQKIITVAGQVPRSLDAYIEIVASGKLYQTELAEHIGTAMQIPADDVRAMMEIWDCFLMNIISSTCGFEMEWQNICFDQKIRLSKALETLKGQCISESQYSSSLQADKL